METSKASARENILARIRKGQRAPASSVSARGSARCDLLSDHRTLGSASSTNVPGNLTEVFQTADAAASAEALETILSTVPAGEVYVQDDASLHPFVALLEQWRRVRLSSEGAPAESTQASLTLRAWIRCADRLHPHIVGLRRTRRLHCPSMPYRLRTQRTDCSRHCRRSTVRRG